VGEPDAEPAVESARGVRAVEARLWAALEPLAAAGLAAPALLALPVRVIVPSRSLREHLSGELLRRSGRALLGVAVQTLHRLAEEILERAGEAPPAGLDLLPIAVRRLAREEPALRQPLDGLADGYGVVEAVVADLLDAGLEAAHAEAVEDLLREELGSGEAGERGRAALRVAARVAELPARGLPGHRSLLFRRAREILEADPPGAFPARAVLVHGYADATGVQADLLEALVRRRGARVLVDRPPDPERPEEEDPSAAFGDRLALRLARGARPRAGPEPGLAGPEIRVLRAPGPGAEARALALHLRLLLDAGQAPERIGVVARDLGPYRLPLRLHLGRLAIPFSGLAEPGPAGPAERRLSALLDLLRQGGELAAPRWLEAVVALPAAGAGPGQRLPPSAQERADLRRGLAALGVSRLGELAALDLSCATGISERGGVELPVRRGLRAPETGGAPYAPHRLLRREILDAAQAAARGALARALPRDPPESLAAHAARLARLVDEDLGWEAALPERLALAALFAAHAGSPRGELVLDAEELSLWLERALPAALRPPLGGAGGGVQVLSVMEARGRSFEHLCVLGLNRGAFPRPVSEDPILPDPVRRRIRSLLPDLPVKSEGADEERFLFAQLLSASPRVLLAFSVCDDDGKARPPSPLLERLRLPEPEQVPGLYAPEAASAEATARPAHEQALLAGLYGTRARFEEALAAALAERRALLGEGAGEDPAILARARRAVLEELDPGPGPRPDPGPYLGFVGEVAEPADPRRGPLYVTTLERVAACPWEAFLTRLLRLELPGDALDALPSVTPPLLGSLVHAVLEGIVALGLGAAAPTSLAEAVARRPTPVPWPEPGTLHALLARSAEELCRERAIAFPGFARVLALRALPFLEVARELDWGAGPIPALGTEVPGEVALADAAGARRVIHFRADRVDRDGPLLRLTDYKTGRAIAEQLDPARRSASHREQVAQGRALQAAVYARAAGQAGIPRAEGRYAFLDPRTPPHARVFGAPAEDPDFAGALGSAAGAVLEAFDRGAFFPRLLDRALEREPRQCGRCEVREACLRGDSGARGRLAGFVERARAAGPGAPRAAAERALLGLFPLGQGRP